MSLMYEALRHKSSAEQSPGFSAPRSQTAAARYIENLSPVSSNAVMRWKIIAWVLSAGVIALLIALYFFVFMKEQKASGLSPKNSIGVTSHSSKPLPSVANTPAQQDINPQNAPVVTSVSPAPSFTPALISKKSPTEIDKKTVPASPVLSQKVIEEKSAFPKNLPAAQKNAQTQSSDSSKLAPASKPTELVARNDSAQKAPEKESVAAAPIQVTNQVNDGLSLADHFDAMNRELSKSNKLQAGTHLKAIQAALASSSISRLRAEGWYEYHMGNFDASKSIYRKILNRIPGDENATSVLQVIEAKSGGAGASK